MKKYIYTSLTNKKQTCGRMKKETLTRHSEKCDHSELQPHLWNYQKNPSRWCSMREWALLT